ncbi:hypothetical protein [Novosphingobium terrae]|uniref:hypothetical protein n=1 Tax=Novosphingobium terrae TaxID=2726189 RepID=UPI001980099E|nr:hypothetical protein [Novosphingobium terrae]
MAGAAQAHPVLTTDLISQENAVAVEGGLGAAPAQRRLDVAFVNLDNNAGRLRYGVTFQYGTVMVVNPNDYIGHEADHRSLRVDREIYVGATSSLRVHGQWRLVAGAGALQLRMHDGFDDSTRLWFLNEPELMGWRSNVGLQHPLGPLVMTMGWQMTRYPGQRQGDPSQPTRGSSSRIGLDITTAL